MTHPLHRQYLTDENKRPIAVVIPIEEFEELEEYIEDHELGRLMDEAKNSPVMTYEEGLEFYHALPKNSE